MATSAKRREIDLSGFPPGSVTEYTTLVCLACTFDIFTAQLGLAPRTAYSEIKHYSPTVQELTAPRAVRPFFDNEELVSRFASLDVVLIAVHHRHVTVEFGIHLIGGLRRAANGGCSFGDALSFR